MSGGRPRWWPAYVGLGSNLDDPVARLHTTFGELDRLPDTHLVLQSSLYRSAPVGPQDQPDFVNAAAALLTRLPAAELLAALQGLEQAAGRRRDGPRWGPRTLDLDLLVFASQVLDTPELTLPHPRIAERNFVLLPLSEIAPFLAIPGLGSVAALAAAASRTEPAIERLDMP